MEKVYISDFTNEMRKELIILIFEAFYPNSKLEYNDRFILSLIESSHFMKTIFKEDSIDVFNFDKDFGSGTFQDLVDCLRINKKDPDIIDSLSSMNLS